MAAGSSGSPQGPYIDQPRRVRRDMDAYCPSPSRASPAVLQSPAPRSGKETRGIVNKLGGRIRIQEDLS